MQNHSSHELVLSLKQMVSHCRDIQTLLKQDSDHFSRSEIASVDASNQNKATLLEKLAGLINQISARTIPNQTGTFIEAIEKESENFDLLTKSEIDIILKELRTEIASAYQYLVINSKIVFTNINQIQQFWDSLLAFRSKIECVYDHKGHTSSK